MYMYKMLLTDVRFEATVGQLVMYLAGVNHFTIHDLGDVRRTLEEEKVEANVLLHRL